MEKIGSSEDFRSAGRKLVRFGDHEIMVFAVGDKWVAYENRCPHFGGPVCQGRIMPAVTKGILPDAAVEEDEFSADEFHIVCPWHGWEFDLQSGRSMPDGQWGLRRFEIEEREDELYITA